MTAFYNEIDPFAAQWLRNLISAGHIAPGVVDERSIEDINPEELREFRQCHFFAGIGVWSYALRRAGWPAFHHLIGSVRPPVVFGEQVASKDGRTWLSLVHADMEALGYSFGASDLCAAGLGAPHIRQRLYWVADAADSSSIRGKSRSTQWFDAESTGEMCPSRMAHHHPGLEVECVESARAERSPSERGGEAGELADTGLPESSACGIFENFDSGENRIRENRPCGDVAAPCSRLGELGHTASVGRTQPSPRLPDVSGFSTPWSSCVWIPCRDGKSRPVEPGTFPLAHGAPARVGRLRAYGNAIVPQVAEAFIRSYLEAVMLKDLLS